MRKIFQYIFILLASLVVAQSASASTGSIVPGFHTTKVCHDSTCTTPTPGILNFRPTGATAVVVDDVTGLSGDVWGNELGWIDLNPTGEGVTFSNPTTGLLTGKAWSQVSGWINFAPTGQTVTIDPSTGQFSGYAWTGGPRGGWIKFNCSSNDTCIKTTWAPTASSGGGGGGSGSYIDVCLNIPGIQRSIPSGYTVDRGGACIPATIDMCPNLPGDQSSIPTGFTINEIGACIFKVDYCSNIPGIQMSIPSGHTLSPSGQCLLIQKVLDKDACPDISGIQKSWSECGPTDVCTNIAGPQTEVPQGYAQWGNQCFPQVIDMCTNIEGNQLAVPAGVIITNLGECIEEPKDYCSNIAGYQSEVPKGYTENDGLCLFDDPGSVVDLLPEGSEVVAFSFLPESVQIPSDNKFLKSVVRILGLNKSEDFKVDLVSSAIYTSLLALFIYSVIRLIRRVREHLTNN